MKTNRLIVLAAALTLALAACGGGTGDGGSDGDAPTPVGASAGDALAGADVFKGTCAGCHGGGLEGIDGLGSTLAPSDFVTSLSEADLAAFIAVGRPAGDPANTTGVDMPLRGGNPALSDQDLLDVAAYLQAQN
ncbi:MAG: cytochrome c [Actinomycetota bacterium]|nr:cytochrome c [Actinomycetota bacterium]